MTETKTKLEYETAQQKGGVPVIIVAAGSATRMRGINKQLLEIGGIPVIVRTMRQFESCDEISRIILVTKAEEIFNFQLLGAKYGISKLSDIVCGGDSRQESVLKGFERVGVDEENVLIHDGARPLVDSKTIRSVVNALENHCAVTCGVKVKDTIKQIDKWGKVEKTLDRNNLLSIQTPQGVRKREYLQAVSKAEDISVFTDDMSVMESAGFDVFTVEGNYKNIKITTPEDVILAQSYLGEEE